jgi:hypothetical protein
LAFFVVFGVKRSSLETLLGLKPGLTLNLNVKHVLYVLHISIAYQSSMRKITLLFCCFLGKDVTFERVLPLDFPRTR